MGWSLGQCLALAAGRQTRAGKMWRSQPTGLGAACAGPQRALADNSMSISTAAHADANILTLRLSSWSDSSCR